MANTTFHFYSENPQAVHAFLCRSGRPGIVRFHGRKAGQLPVYKMTVVLDDLKTASEFEAWLDRRSNKVRPSQIGFKSDSGVLYRLHRFTLLYRIHRRLSGLFGAARLSSTEDR